MRLLRTVLSVLPLAGTLATADAAAGADWATFLGGEAREYSWAVVEDENGLVTVVFDTESPGFDTTPDAFQPELAGDRDVMVVQLDPSQSGADQLVWATYLGGTGHDHPYDLVRDSDGTFLITGLTQSSDFPTTPGSYDQSLDGVQDAFVARLSSDGTELLSSTLLGGSGVDWCTDLAIDSSGGITVGGYTSSLNFPMNDGAGSYDTTYNGGPLDAFVARLDLSQEGADQLLWATYLGGIGEEGILYAPNSSLNASLLGVDVTGSGDVFVGGWTRSSNFPTENAFDASYNGGGDAFVCHLSADGTDLVWSTFLGGSASDAGIAVAVVDGVVTLVAAARTGFPTTPGAYDTEFGGSSDAAIVRLDPSRAPSQQLLYSTYLGTGLADGLLDVGFVDGVVTAVGFKDRWAEDPLQGGAWIVQLQPDGNGPDDLIREVLMGGSNFRDGFYGLARSTLGNAHLTVCGITDSPDFPVSPDCYDSTFGGLRDAIAARVELCGSGCPADVDGSGSVDVSDLVAVALAWGSSDPDADVTGDGTVDIGDLVAVILAWGACE